MDRTGAALRFLIPVGGGLLLAAGLVATYDLSQPGPDPLPVFSTIGEFELVDQNERAVTRADLDGTVWVAGVIFTRCPMICAALTEGMSELQDQLPDSGPVKLILLTADPEYDTPQVLREYGEQYGARDDRWLFLTGDREELYRLAINDLKLSVVEKDEEAIEIPNDLFIHSGRFVLIDQRGRIRGWYDGEQAPSRAMIPAAI